MAEKKYIDSEAAFNAILKLVPKVDGDGYCWVIRGDAAIAIDSIPAADVREVVRSHWFDGACVNCGFKPLLDYEYATVYDRMYGYAWNFCPNCGADMREES